MREIKELNIKDLKDAIQLVNEVFEEFVAVDYSMEGQQTFHNFLKHKYSNILSDLNTGYKKMWCCYIDGKIVGVIATRDISHVSLLFVSKEYQRMGIAKELFQTVKHSLSNQNITKITVNSSPYAVPIYEHIGFVATSIELENNGMRYTPMEYNIKGNMR